MSQIAILDAFSYLPAPRRIEGQRHDQSLCLARGPYEAICYEPKVESHPAIMLVSAYIIE